MVATIKDVFQITNNPSTDKTEWHKIGVAFENKDGSLNVILDSIPLNGKMHIRDRVKVISEDPAY